MDALKDKLKKLSLLGSGGKAKGAFQGTGHRLGGGDGSAAVPAPRAAQQQQPALRPRVVVPPAASSASSSQAATQQQQQQQQQPQPSPKPEAARQQPQVQPPSRSPPPQKQQAAPLPQPPAPALPAAAGDHPAGEAVALAVSQLASDPAGAAAAEVLSRLLGNVVGSPGEPKFRRVRLSNPRIAAAVVETGGGVELLLACGFEIAFEEAPGGSGADQAPGGEAATEGYAVLPADADLAPLQHALHLLAALLPAAPPNSRSCGDGAAAGRSSAAVASSSSSGSVQQQAAAPPRQQQAQAQARRPQRERDWDPPRERNTQVLLPTSVERDVPDWFFQRTGQELKAAFLAATRRREQDQVLMTRATRERLRGAPLPEAGHATVRVRFPEGISLQGEFGPGEPVAALFGWVADCLADPLHTYDLVLPSRRTLEPAAQSVREAGLLPSAVLLFRWTGASAQEMAAVPALRADLLRAARPAPVAY